MSLDPIILDPEEAKQWLEAQLVVDFKIAPRPVNKEKIEKFARELQDQ